MSVVRLSRKVIGNISTQGAMVSLRLLTFISYLLVNYDHFLLVKPMGEEIITNWIRLVK